MKTATPVLYVAETNDDGDVDWQSYIAYAGGDEYVLYGSRNSGNHGRKCPDVKMNFLSREALSIFLTKTCCVTSTINVTMYLFDETHFPDFCVNNMMFNDFRRLRERMNLRYAELFGYDKYGPYNKTSVMNLLLMLRDMRA
jgi:hypothetical protein